MNIKLDSLSVKAGKKTLIEDISVEFTHGKITALIGENGSGKSTLIKAAAGLLKFNSGEICYGNVPLKNFSLKALARIRSVVLQSPFLPEGTTAGELLSLARYAFDSGKCADRAAIEKAVNDTGCATFMDRKLETLSGGELRRIYLACALAQEPEILFLDEAEANTDAQFRAAFPGLLHRLCRERELTVVMVTHDLDLALNTADRILGLKSGRSELDISLSASNMVEKIVDFTGEKWEILPGKGGKLRALPTFCNL